MRNGNIFQFSRRFLAAVLALSILFGVVLSGCQQDPLPTGTPSQPNASVPSDQSDPTEGTEPSVGPTEPALDAPAVVWDMEHLPADMVASGMAGVNGNDHVPGNVVLGKADGKGLNGSAALAYRFVGDYSKLDMIIMTAISLQETQFKGNWSDGEMLWFWVNGSEMNNRFHLELQVNGAHMQIDAPYYTIDDNGRCVEAGVLPEGWNQDSLRARVIFEAGWEGWVGFPLSMYNDPDSVNSLMLHIGNSAVKAGNVCYLDEFWITKRNEVPDLPLEQLTYKSTDATKESGKIWDLNDIPDGTELGEVISNPSYNPISGFAADGKGVSLSGALAYNIIGTVGRTNCENLDLKASALSGLGFNTRTIVESSDILWFWVASAMKQDQMIHIQLNASSAFLAEKAIYTIAQEGGKPVIREVPYVSSAGQITSGMAPCPYDGNTTGKYVRIKVCKGWSGWIGIPVSNFCVDGNGAAVASPAGELNEIRIRLYGNAGSVTEGDTMYFDEFWLTPAEKMPGLSNDKLLYVKEPEVASDLRLSSRFENGMIFQQKKPWEVKGTAVAGLKVTVKLLDPFGKAVQTMETRVGDDNAWSVSMAAVNGSYTQYTIQVICGDTTRKVTDVVFGEVWAAGGQSNMAYAVYRSSDAVMTAEDRNALKVSLAANDKASFIRFYMNDQSYVRDNVRQNPAGSWGNGSNWSKVKNCSAVAFLFAMNLQEKLDVPVGVVVAAKGGTGITSWIDTESAKAYPEYYSALSSAGYAKYNASDADNSQRHYLSGWYNGQVAPWQGYEVKGILWYQGEQDRNNPIMQNLGIPALVASWSKTFDSEGNASKVELPFITIQIAPYNTYTTDADLGVNTALNEAMRQGTAKVVAAGGKAVCVPIYDFRIYVNNIHPVNKPEIGIRCADTAYGLVYNKNANVAGPVVKSVDYSTADKGYITITFDNAGTALKYIRLTEEKNFRLSDPAKPKAGISVELYRDCLDGFSIWTATEILPVQAQVVGTNQVKLLLPERGDGGYYGVAGIYYAYGQQVLTANLYNSFDYPALPFFLERDDGQKTTHQTPLWNADNEPETVLKANNASSGRNTSKISIAAGVGYGGTNALKYELLTSGNERTHTWNWGNPGVFGFRTDVTAAADDDILWFWLEANVSTIQRLQFGVNGVVIAQSEDSFIYTLEEDASGNVQLVKIPYGGNDSVDGISLVKYPNNAKEAQIQIEPGWSGWVGIPANTIRSNGTPVLTKGDTITKLSVLLFQVEADGSKIADQKVGDHVILDEFWLTSEGCYPPVKDIVLHK